MGAYTSTPHVPITQRRGGTRDGHARARHHPADESSNTTAHTSPHPPGPRRAAALQVPAGPRVRRARLDPAPRLQGRDRSRVGERQVAAAAHGEEPRRAGEGLRAPPRRRSPRGHPARHGGAGDDVDAHHAADAEHDGRDEPPGRSDPSLHGAGVQRAERDVAQPPALRARLAARGRHVGGRGTHAPLPDEGAGGTPVDVPPVLRALHADGPRRQQRAAGPEAPLRAEEQGAVRGDRRVPQGDAERPRRGREWGRHRQPADRAPRGLRDADHRDPEHQGHPPRYEGADGAAAALPAGRRAGRARADGAESPASTTSTSPCTRT